MSTANAPFAYWSTNEDVVVLRWPEQRTEADRLARLSLPRLLLVEPGAPPPETVSCLEDWVRMPADDGDIRARLEALAHRALEHPSLPSLDGHGQLSFRGQRVFLSPIDERIAAVLVSAFDRAVSEEDLLRDVWPDGGHAGTAPGARFAAAQAHRAAGPRNQVHPRLRLLPARRSPTAPSGSSQ